MRRPGLLRAGGLLRHAAREVVQRAGRHPADRGTRRPARRRRPDHPLRTQPGRSGHLLRPAALGRRPVRCPRPEPGVVGVHRQPGEQLRRPRPGGPAGRLPVPGHRGDPPVRRVGRLADRPHQHAGEDQRAGRVEPHPCVRLLQHRPRGSRQHPLHTRQRRRQPRQHHLRVRPHDDPSADRDDRRPRAAAQPGSGPDPAPAGRSGLPTSVRAAHRSGSGRVAAAPRPVSRSRTFGCAGSTGAARR